MSEQTVCAVQPNEQALVILVQKRSLDAPSTRQLVDDVLTLAAGRPGVPIVLDLSRVRFAPSVALGSLVQLSKSFKLDGRRIALIGIDRHVLEAIRITRLDTVLEIHDTLDGVISPAKKTS